ncbi:MAG: Tyrosine recombinase XerC [Fimbriimonadaceae bacterium]|nr:Tyrosine recombinase XerC [Fimbriimonadaceae bacterium]
MRQSDHISNSAKTPAQASTDDEVIRLWLYGRPLNTERAYLREVERFRNFVQKSLRTVTLGDVQAFADSICEMKSSSVARALAAIKSLMSFAHEIGYVQFNTGTALRLPTVRNRRAERILTEEQVMRMLALTKTPRDHALLRLAYASALRISELASLSWSDLTERGDAGQVSVMAKGGKTHTVLLSVGTWCELVALRKPDSQPDSPVFGSRKGNRLSKAQIHRVVVAAAQRAGIASKVSMHWMRHAHASHALDRGAPIHLVSQTLNHSNLATTSVYVHARPTESSGKYLGV